MKNFLVHLNKFNKQYSVLLTYFDKLGFDHNDHWRHGRYKENGGRYFETCTIEVNNVASYIECGSISKDDVASYDIDTPFKIKFSFLTMEEVSQFLKWHDNDKKLPKNIIMGWDNKATVNSNFLQVEDLYTWQQHALGVFSSGCKPFVVVLEFRYRLSNYK